MNKKLTLCVAVIIIIGAIIGIIVSRKSHPQSSSISLGLILPMTDFLSSYGEHALGGAQLALKDYPNVTLHVEDDKCATTPALNAFQKLTHVNHPDIIIGPLCGSPQEAIAPLLKQNPIPVLLPAAASENLFKESNESMFNIQYSLENEGGALAQKMNNDGHKTAVIIGYKNAFSEAEVNGFKKNYPGTIAKEIWFTDNTADIRTEITKLKGVTFDAIFSADIAFYFAKGTDTLKRNGITTTLYSPYPVEDPSARPLAEGVIYSFPGNIVGDQGATYGLAYDAVKKAVAVATVCKSDRACILKKLKADPDFDLQGTSKRSIVFKQIVNGQGVVLE